MEEDPTPIYDEMAAAETQPEPTSEESAQPESAAEPVPNEPTAALNDQYVLSTLPHEDINAEDHIGDEIPDPWKDPAQTDWPMADDLAIGDDNE